MLNTISNSVISGTPNVWNIVLCTGFSLVLGLCVAFVYMFKNQYSKSLAMTLVMIPAIVQIVIMLTSGNIGAGVATAGAFNLVRFRSLPGKARDIGSLFFAMALGLATGMGFLFYAFIFTLLIGFASIILTASRFGQKAAHARTLRITIPENIDYDGLFNEVFSAYTQSSELIQVKTTNMGSMYELTYTIQLKSDSMPKAFIDELRCRNGNLNIILSREKRDGEEL